MEQIRFFLVLLLLMKLFVYMVPREHHAKSIRKLLAIWMTVLLVYPILQWMHKPDLTKVLEDMERIERRVETHEFVGGDSVFEIFPVEQME